MTEEPHSLDTRSLSLFDGDGYHAQKENASVTFIFPFVRNS